MSKRKFTTMYCTFLLGLVCTIGTAQVTVDTLLASQYFKKGDSLLTERELDSSIVYFNKALPIYQKAKAWERVAGCYNKISKCQWLNHKNMEALSNAKKVLEMSVKYLSKKSIQEAYAYNNMGVIAYKNHKLDQALKYFQKSLTIRKESLKLKDSENHDTYFNIGLLYFYKEQFYESSIYLNKALAIRSKILDENHESLLTSYKMMGSLYLKTGEYDKALYFLEKKLSILVNGNENQYHKLIVTLNLIGTYYKKRGDLDKGLSYYLQALSIKNKIEEKERKPYAYLYNNIGLIYKYKGEYDRALNFHKKALDKISPNNSDATSLKHNNLGYVYFLKKEFNLALFHYQKALDIGLNLYGENNSNVAYSYNNIAELYKTQKKYKKALEYSNRALNIRNQIFGKNHRDVANSYISIGNILLEKKEYQKAISHHQEALEIQANIFGNHHPKVAQSYNHLAQVYLDTKKYDLALEQYQKAIIANTPSNTNNHYFNLDILLSTLQGQAKIYTQLYQENRNINDLKNAIRIYQKADTISSTIRQSFTNYQDKVRFAQKAKDIYQGAIQTQLLLYTTQKDQEALRQAFTYAEKSKANTLKELLNDANAKSFTGLPTDLIALEKELRIDKAFYQSKITESFDKLRTQTKDSSTISRFENKLFEINRKQDSLTQVLEQNYPKYYQLKHKNEVISVADIQKRLPKQTTLLEFFTSDSITYAFTISKNQMAVQELATPNLIASVAQYKNAITSKNTEVFKKSAHHLYQQLIAPIADRLVGNELIIVPDGPLWHLNVELLLTQNDDSNNPKDLSYLLKDYAITYANSATVLFSDQQEQISKKQEECLAFSFTDSTAIIDTKSMSLATLRDAGDDLPGT